MKERRLATLAAVLLLLSGSGGLQAQTSAYVLTANGKVLTQPVEVIYKTTTNGRNSYFSGQRVISLQWKSEEGTWESISLHPQQLEMLFGEDAITGIGQPKLYDGGIVQGKLSLSGLPEGTPVKVFDAGGRMCLSAQAKGGDTALDIHTLPGGIYIAKAGKTVFKFVKK